MNRIVKISAVSYLNSKPFIYGIENSEDLKDYSLELDIPSVCSEKLLSGKVDIGLIPVATIPNLIYHKFLTNYCIGTNGIVDSVVLYCETEIDKIEKIMLDYQSKTSVALVQILARKYWKIKPSFAQAKEGFETLIGGKVAGVVIGDRTFALKNKFKFTYDLSEEWKKFTSLPFVFACWVTNKKLTKEIEVAFNKAIRHGIENKNNILPSLQKSYPLVDVKDYLTNKIDYLFDDKKKQALNLFLKYLKELQHQY